MSLPAAARFYWLTLAAVMVVYLLALYALLGVLVAELPRRRRGLLAGALLGLYWAGLPSTRETIYWFTGSIENQLSVALLLRHLPQPS